VDLALDPGVRIHGFVKDPSGSPIPGAEVGLGGSFKRSATTNLEGEYELVGVGGVRRRDLSDLRARAEGYGGERAKLPFAELVADTRVDFVLRAGRVATGRVVDPEGTPLEGVYVAGSGTTKAEGVSRTDWVSVLTGADGRFALTSLHPLVDHQLFLKKGGHGTRIYDFPADEADRERVDVGDLVLHPGGRIEGTLTTASGVPIPEHSVKLRGANDDLGRFRPDGEGIPNTWVTTVRESRTDADGRFHFDDVPGGTMRVTAAVQGQPSANDERTVELAEGQQVDGVTLRLELGTPITGVVLTPDRSPATGVFVQVAGGPDTPRIRARSGAGGRFELLGVTEATGEVELFTIVASYNWYHPDARLGASPTARARAGDSDVELVLQELVSLSGRVEDAEGAPVVGAQVLAYRSGAPQRKDNALMAARTDEAGAFRLDLPEQGEVDLVAKSPIPPGAPAAEPGSGSEAAPEPAVLEFVASDAEGVVLRFER
jgi:protocatechuate 3,4-dioxygenase beta subunit